MSTSKMRTVASWVIAFLPALIMLMPHPVFAGTLGTDADIPTLAAAQTKLVTFVTALAGFACIFLLGVLVWDFVQHRNVARSIFEFLGVVLLGIVAVNSQAVANAFAGNGAIL